LISREEKRLLFLFGQVLPAGLILPFVLAGCSTSRAPAADAGPPPDPCKPTLAKLFLGVVDGADECRATQNLACGLPENVSILDGGCQIRASDCKSVCPSFGAFNCEVADASCPNGHAVREGPVRVVCDFCPGGLGRRPAGHVELEACLGVGMLGTYFERAAYLEAASVRAFAELHVALESVGAPYELVQEAARARQDELRHFRATVRLARRFGGRAPRTQRATRGKSAKVISGKSPASSVDIVVLENALEGCVRETYGALLASFQARRAQDAAIRSTMASIAADETRHAARSWAIARWSETRISDAAARAAGSVLSTGVRELYSLVREPHEHLALLAGMPTADEQRRLLAHLEANLWS
jgi:hypothetical protein